MKKFLFILLFIMLIPIYTYAEGNDAYVAVDGIFLQSEDDLIKIKDDRVFIKLTSIAKEFSDTIKWDNTNRSIEITRDNLDIHMKIKDKNYTINNKSMTMDTEPFIYKDKAYVPIRFIAESFNQKIIWDGANKIVLIGDFKSVDNFSDGKNLNFDFLNISFKVPKDFEETLIYVEDKNTNNVNFYNKFDYERTNSNYGLVFTLSREKYPRSAIIPGTILKYEDGYYTEATFASDVQYIPTDINSKKSYSDAFVMSKKIIETYKPIEKAD